MVLVTMALVAVLSVIMVALALIRYLEPDPQAPDLLARQPQAVTRHAAQDDAPVGARPEPPGPAFDEVDRCALEIILAPEDDALIEEANVRAYMSGSSPRAGERFQATEEGDNRWRIDDLPCGVAGVKATVDGYVPARRDKVDSVVARSVTVPLALGLTLRGTVFDQDGEPIHRAKVRAEHMSDRTDRDGAYEILVDPAELWSVSASAEGFLDDSQRLRLPEDSAEDAVLDFELQASREVSVWCAGLPDDSCASVMLIMCTYPLLPWGSVCRGDPTRCECPEGSVAIRGGGQSVELAADSHEAWLDFRGTGSAVGRVLRHGEPVDCDVFGILLPRVMPDLRSGFMDGRDAECDADGRFLVQGLAEGRWQLEISLGSAKRSVNNLAISAGQQTDVGEIDLSGGGLIEGVVLHGLTGQGAPGEMVMAVTAVVEDDVPATQSVFTGSEGAFQIRGLDDGSYLVVTSSRPFTRESVEVRDGAADREVVLTTGDADLLDENGFSLITDEAGELVVDQVAPGGFAAGAGLHPGDQIDGVLIAGFDLASVLPSLEDQLVETVLEHYGGPGVSLKVTRDGQQLEVELE